MKSSQRPIRTTVALAALAGLLLGLPACDDGSGTVAGGGPAAAGPAPSANRESPAGSEPRVEGDRMSGFVSEAPLMSAQPESSPFRFAEVAREAGIDFVHFSGMTEDKHFPTANGSGVAMFDHDGDGKLDLYFATATLLPLGTTTKGPNRLYKNLGDGRFRDMTEASGLGFQGYCHGIVVGDIDNDGDQDVFLCNYGPNVLYLNRGDGTFEDISKSAGVDRSGWSSGGAFLDYDRDGDLDLYVANYGEWTYPQDDQYCGNREKHVRLYCSPRTIRTVRHYLYRNNGDTTFTDVAEAAGVGRGDGHGFGVVAADLNADGLTDLYVANDMNPNFLFLNKGDGTFEDATETSGAAFDEKGQAQSGMGVDAEDVNGDGLPDVIVTNFANEYNTLYQNIGKGSFMDVTPYFGLASDTLPWVGWGTALADLDNDGWPDSFVANGQVDDNRRRLGQNIPYEEPALLFANRQGQRFRLATRDAGSYFEGRHVGRGAAFGDIDNDGDIDIVVNHKDGPPALLRNDSKHENHWIRLELQGTRSNRDAVGSRVVVVADGLTIHRQRKGGCSMESANDPRLLIGVGKAREVEKLTISWPAGGTTTMQHLETGRSYRIVEPADVPPGK
jgi:hypothetical protein